MKRASYQSKSILITVKTYPVPSMSYGETVCCAGIDIDNFQLIRIYPVLFRDLDYDKRFKKYTIIKVDCAKTSHDRRPESYYIEKDSIKIIEYLKADKLGWKRRKEIISKIPLKSFCQITQEAEANICSLGLVKPENISFYYKKRSNKDKDKREIPYQQRVLFGKNKEPIELIPFQFYYKFRCSSETNCSGHDLSIIDWEINQAYRKWRNKYTDENILLSKIASKWTELVDTQNRDVYFYIGNHNWLHRTFFILGIFSPYKNLT